MRAKYAPRIEGSDPTKCFIIERAERSIGFIQSYQVIDDPILRVLVDQPEFAAGIDLFLGDRSLAYHGAGPRIVRGFLHQVVFVPPETNVCIIDPAQNNFAAIRAYKKAGFQHIRTIQVPGELEPSYVMVIRRDELDHE